MGASPHRPLRDTFRLRSKEGGNAMRGTRRRAIPLASSIAVALVVAFIVSPASSVAARSAGKAQPVARSWVGVDARAKGAAAGVGARVADARAALARTLG